MRHLLVNPPVYDFAAYDYWLKPLGLLYISALLKERGETVDFIDFLDRSHPAAAVTESSVYGKGHFETGEAPIFKALNKFKRNYRIYGISGEKLNKLLYEVKPPDKIFLTSGMTYWYPGVKEAAVKLKKHFPDAELLLGGTYATLMKEHAELNIPADRVIAGNGLDVLSEITGDKMPEFDMWPAPDYSGYRNPGYIVLRTSAGCPYRCPYCGIGKIHPKFRVKQPEKTATEIKTLYDRYGLRDFVFYDDALLKNKGFANIFNGLPESLRFHTPNGLEVNEITPQIAGLLKENNFIDPCLAADHLGSRDNKTSKILSRKNIAEAAAGLFNAGYKKGGVSAYLILGLPGQKIKNIKKSAEFLHGAGLKVRLAEYAVVPGSADISSFSKEIQEEPLMHNNSTFPSFDLSRWGDIFKLKKYVNKLNESF